VEISPWAFCASFDYTLINPLAPTLGGRITELGDTPKPSAGTNPCTLLGFRIWSSVTLSGGFAPLHPHAGLDSLLLPRWESARGRRKRTNSRQGQLPRTLFCHSRAGGNPDVERAERDRNPPTLPPYSISTPWPPFLGEEKRAGGHPQNPLQRGFAPLHTSGGRSNPLSLRTGEG
jgi:hypothetical protein